jgi:hypothetical protein
MLAVDYKLDDSPAVLLYTERPQEQHGLGTDRDWPIASSQRCDATMVLRKCPLSSDAVLDVCPQSERAQAQGASRQ